MSDAWKNLILKAKPEPASDTLLSAVFARIYEERTALQARSKFFIFSALSFLSAAALIFSIVLAHGEFSRSGFSAFATLIWTDFSAVASFWKSYLSSLAETLPTMSVILVLAAVFAFINFLRMALKNLPANHHHIGHKIA